MSNCTRLILKDDALFQFVFEYQGGVCYTSKDLVLKGSDKMSSFMEKRKGLLCTFAIAVVSVMLDKLFPVIGSAVFAIILGMVLNQFWKIPSDFRPGINYSAKKLLHYSIIALGFTMSFAQVSQTGASSFPVTIVTISIAFLTALLVGNFFKLSRPLKILVGFGTAICGGSAIAAASPIIRAEDDEVALSISTIFLFNVIAVFLFPFLGHMMGMDASQFGLFAGTAINDTSSVVAAGASYSAEALEIATIVKLTRALMIVPACLVLSFVEARRMKQEGQSVQWKNIVPMFIIWFMVASIITSVGLFPNSLVPYAKLASNWLMAMALAGIGMQVSFQQFKEAGAKPILTGLATWFMVTVTSLIMQYFVL